MKNLLFFLIAMGLFAPPLSASASWQSLPAYCLGPSIFSVKAKLEPGNSESTVFDFRYQLLKANVANAPTILVIPGGPGGISIRDWSAADADTLNAFARYGFPAGYNILFTDPRSIGCNLGDATAFPDNSISTENFAQDIVAIIRELHLKDYYIYGHSYGSQVGTVLAGLVERQGVQPPKAVILSGVLGRTFYGEGETTAAQLGLQWNRLKPMLPVNVVATMQGISPIGISSEKWAIFLMWGLYKQSVLVGGHMAFPLRDQLSLLASGDSRDSARLKSIVLAPSAGPEKSKEEKESEGRMNSIVACREISDVDYDLRFEQGEVRFGDKVNCSPWGLDRPYDAKDWPTSRPIFYISGEFDPAAPPFQAQHHIRVEGQTDRFLIAVTDGGHSKIGDFLPDCKEGLWKSFSAEGAGLADALAGCVAETKLTVFPRK